jgi:hypothetical protein
MAELVDLAERQNERRARQLVDATNGFVGVAQQLLRRGMPETEILKALTATTAKLIAETVPGPDAHELARRVAASLPETVAFLSAPET